MSAFARGRDKLPRHDLTCFLPDEQESVAREGMRPTVEDRAPDLDIADLCWVDRVRILLEHGEVRPLADLNRSDLVFEPQAASALDGDGTQCCGESQSLVGSPDASVTGDPIPVSYTHLTLPTIYSV